MIVKIAIFVLVAFFLYRMFMNDKGKKEENTEKEKNKKVAAGLMVKDPICGTYVEKESSVSVKNGDKTEYFCSYECREKYIKQIEEQNHIGE